MQYILTESEYKKLKEGCKCKSVGYELDKDKIVEDYKSLVGNLMKMVSEQNPECFTKDSSFEKGVYCSVCDFFDYGLCPIDYMDVISKGQDSEE